MGWAMNTTIKAYFTLYEPFIGEKTIYLAPKKNNKEFQWNRKGKNPI